MNTLLERKTFNNNVTKEQFIEDLECMFANLKESYGMYDYFGDSKFTVAKETIIKHLDNGFDVVNTVSIVRDALSFIKDGHFFIGVTRSKDDKVIYDYAIKYTEYKGIQVIDCKKFYHDTLEEKKELEEFANKGSEYHNSKPLILDFRGNGGGSTMYIYDFLKGLTAQDVGYSLKFLQRSSSLFKDYLDSQQIEWIPQNSDQYQEEICPQIKNEKKIFVLIDEKTASAAEEGIAYLKNIENVTIVGDHSAGCASCGNCISIFLPNSHMEVYFGTGIVLYNGNQNIDAEGGFKGDMRIEAFEAMCLTMQFHQ